MAEPEVENILREIRERVLEQENTRRAVSPLRAESMNGANGASDHAQLARPDNNAALIEETFALIQSYLSTTARTWDRLPPLLSNRSGLMARIELWLKRRLKTGTRWFTWEQVNFNAAIHHAVRDLLPVLASQEQELARLRAQLKTVSEIQQAEQAQSESERAQLQTDRAQFQREREQRQTERAHVQTTLSGQRVDIETQQRTIEALRIQTDARFGDLVSELRESIQHLREEQRVCFKQLAIESTEATVLEDRARRNSETLLAELGQRIEQLEKNKK